MTEANAPLEDSLVRRCVSGESSAWRVLHSRYYATVAGFLRKMGVYERELEDASQDVFLQVFRYLGGFRHEAGLKTWIYRICATEARRRRRRARVTGTLLALLKQQPAAHLSSGPGVSEAMALRRVQTALGRMKEGERLVFVLYEMEGLSGAQIAEIVGCPVATVWRRLHYARKAFKNALGLTPLMGGSHA